MQILKKSTETKSEKRSLSQELILLESYALFFDCLQKTVCLNF